MANDREKKLQVKDLTISFKTINGKLQAVRDISFDLYKGETLAIVGESGSGKSATSKTILGISAGNTIVESGEILYDGKDLLKISEDDFHKIRGDKISMVFQDPLSSLNPIMRIGNQITEAMILKNKANRKESHKKLAVTLTKLGEAMKACGCADDSARFATFKKIIGVQAKYEAPYSQAYSSAVAGLKAAEDMLLAISKEAVTNPVSEAKEVADYFKASIDRFVVRDAQAMGIVYMKLIKASHDASKSKKCDALVPVLEEGCKLLKNAIDQPAPDFFALGLWVVTGGNALGNEDSKELNEKTAVAFESDYFKAFAQDAKKALEYTSSKSIDDMKSALEALADTKRRLSSDMPEKTDADKLVRSVADAVEAAIDPLETVKDSYAYTFRVSLSSAVKTYYDDVKGNLAEEKRFIKQTAKYERLEAKGKAPEAKVAPLSLSDLKLVQSNIIKILTNMQEQFEKRIEDVAKFDFDKRSRDFILWLRETAMAEIRVVTKSMAKDRAIRVMEQVGIPEARKRYRQYPFEFSGGMRQRIVIAISLTANPDILICDEPTTALDVTIQAQILELINKLKHERNLSVIFITHDLGVVANMADRIAVMYAGKIVEYGTADEIFYSPAHPYTWALLASIPDLDSKGDKLESIPGTPPNMIYPPKGDAFAARNKYAMEIDFEEQPPMFKITDTHYAATWLLHPNAPHVEMPAIVRDRIARMSKRGGEQ